MKLSFEAKRILYAAVYPLLFLLLLWLIEFVKIGMNWNLSFMGIYPRSLHGVIGIFSHYLLHSNFEHLWSNTIPLLVLGWFLFYFYGKIAWRTLGGLWISTGVLLWFIGRPGVHVGASGLIYALTFFLVFSGIFRRYTPLMAVSLIVVFQYGSMTWGIFPFSEIIKPDMSWEGHLSGAISGFVMAFILRNQGPQKPPPPVEEEEEETTIPWDDVVYKEDAMEQDRSHFLPKDGNEKSV